jgi:hypothetical protein
MLDSAWAGVALNDATPAVGDCDPGIHAPVRGHKVAPDATATAMTDAAVANAHRSFGRRDARCLAASGFKSLIRKDVE